MRRLGEIFDRTKAAQPKVDAGASGVSEGNTALRLRAVVLSGGSNTRLWSVSRKQIPEQPVDVLRMGSLLQKAVRRSEDGTGGAAFIDESPIVVCGHAHQRTSSRQLDELGVGARFIIEPSWRDTAPALSLAAMLAAADGGDSVLVVIPADHAIGDLEAFQRAVLASVRYAERGAIVALGVQPTRADSSYGYIKQGRDVDVGAQEIERFVEKPPLNVASECAASGQYYWSSGILILRASVWLSSLQRMQPAMHAACLAAFEFGRNDSACYRPHEGLYAKVSPSSINHAVMENLGADSEVQGVVIPLNGSLCGLASWESARDTLEKNIDSNVAKGRVVLENATSCYVHSESRLVTCVGVSDLVVVETAEAVWVVDRSRVQAIRHVPSGIMEQRGPENHSNRMVQRPWGYYDLIDQGKRFQIKRVVVQAGAQLALQLHHHRAEHWTVVCGAALVTRGDETFLLSENESAYIPLGVRHRLVNPGKVALELIEVQSGAYLGDDDVVYFEEA
jgi:mannose-1-phosphate guanylyltransferase/mannose-6-phosphate isomerase